MEDPIKTSRKQKLLGNGKGNDLYDTIVIWNEEEDNSFGTRVRVKRSRRKFTKEKALRRGTGSQLVRKQMKGSPKMNLERNRK